MESGLPTRDNSLWSIVKYSFTTIAKSDCFNSSGHQHGRSSPEGHREKYYFAEKQEKHR